MLKTFATIMLIIASVVGFVFSYEVAYNKIAKFMNISQEQSGADVMVTKK